ncbi:DNA repair photolyase [Anaerocolumna jejuensis DSM 15929]|uniref:DNA repair photolyase n=1 Tax=Anaerocolumna jejuensis DSM 15929 TaxID=1121322 RepID=A0A1M6YNF0_9FIRM|nr:hypothetical protein [Anaerocolumna jejuensis]SHL19737.1 DNA repair photolyase [Anaerocolumna jejuensis DSM 15929]
MLDVTEEEIKRLILSMDYNINHEQERDLRISYLELKKLQYQHFPFEEINEIYNLNLKKYYNPYLSLAFIYLCMNQEDCNICLLLKYFIKNKILNFKSGKRIPYLNTKYEIYLKYKQKFHLSNTELRIVDFAIRLGLNYPGIIGSPMNEYAFKENVLSNPNLVNNLKEIVANQIITDRGSINSNYMISQMKGGMSIDLVIGCPMGCIYCYRRDDFGDIYDKRWQPNFIISPSEGIHRLLNHPWFTPHITPLGIHMSTTEAFLPSIWPSTYKILKSLDELKLTNRVTIITKYVLEEEKLALLNEFQYLDIDICVCYSGLPQVIEPTSSKERLRLLANISHYSNLTGIGYYRPIIEGYNTSEDIIYQTFQLFKETGVRVIVIGGLKFSDEHKKYFCNKNIELPTNEFVEGRKYLSESTIDKMRRIFNEVFDKEDNCKLLKHSSCARVVAREGCITDYNGQFYINHNFGCTDDCKNQKSCKSPIIPNEEQINSILIRLFRGKIEYEIKDNMLLIHKELSRYEKTFLTHNLLIPVQSDI